MTRIFDKGSGPPIVVVQPLQGRWQWMRRFLDALAERCRVITYTLCGDLGSDRSLDVSLGFDAYVHQLKDVIDRVGLERTAVCGISFGGTVAARYAARYPDRVTHLIIASSPGPGWQANADQAPYISRPFLTLPIVLWAAFRPAPLHGGLFRTYADHRMAHAAVVLGLAVPGVLVEDVATTAKTFPGFAGAWSALVGG